jgi:NifU-like protein involved in Fe-S cluster formation
MGCCQSTPQSVGDLLHAALARAHWRAPAPAASAEDPSQNLRVEIYLETEGGCIRRIDYRCSSCASLIAYCEAMVRLACGRGVAEAARLDAADLIGSVAGVPGYRHDRARLAAAAFRQALSKHLPHGERSPSR